MIYMLLLQLENNYTSDGSAYYNQPAILHYLLWNRKVIQLFTVHSRKKIRIFYTN